MMPTWILIVVIGQLLLSIVAIVDKFIITSKKVEKPFVYAYFISGLSVLSIAIFFTGLLPLDFLGLKLPSFENIGNPGITLFSMSLVAGFSFFYALVSLYSAFRKADASDVIPVVGSISAVGTFILSYLFLDDVLSKNFTLGFILLAIGTVVISRFRFDKSTLMLTLHAGFMFAINAAMMKGMFIMAGFDQTFFWSRIGIAIMMVSIILIPRYAGKIFANTMKTKTANSFWIIGNAILGGVANLLILKGIEIGNVTIVQALGGLQFVFLIIFSFFIGKLIPEEAGENERSFKTIFQKITAITFIVAGFFYLFL